MSKHYIKTYKQEEILLYNTAPGLRRRRV